MNINELSYNVYGANVRNIQSTGYANKVAGKEVKTENVESFADVLSSYALSGDSDELLDDIKELQEGLEANSSDGVDKSDVMNILTDAQLAKEYLESQSGRNLIVSMVENSIASIISGNNDDDN